jgi:hypothetical protein
MGGKRLPDHGKRFVVIARGDARAPEGLIAVFFGMRCSRCNFIRWQWGHKPHVYCRMCGMRDFLNCYDLPKENGFFLERLLPPAVEGSA